MHSPLPYPFIAGKHPQRGVARRISGPCAGRRGTGLIDVEREPGSPSKPMKINDESHTEKKLIPFDPDCGVIISPWLAKLVNALAAGKVTFSGRTAGPWKKCSSACWAGDLTAAARVTSAFISRLNRSLLNRCLQLRHWLGTNPHVNSHNGSSHAERANRAILLSRRNLDRPLHFPSLLQMRLQRRKCLGRKLL
jgi:hypothetical protein